MPKFNTFTSVRFSNSWRTEHYFYVQMKGVDKMTPEEKSELLKDHLEFLRTTAQDAATDGFYGDVSELSEQILKTVALLLVE